MCSLLGLIKLITVEKDLFSSSFIVFTQAQLNWMQKNLNLGAVVD